MNEKYLSIDLNDPRSSNIAEALANTTCKKILNLIADNEMSATEISNKLNLPLNTTTYNINKLVDSGLIELISKSFWSVKGKKINIYRVSNKRIVISPKSLISNGIVPVIIGSVLITLGIKYFGPNYVSQNVQPEVLSKTADYANGIASSSPAENIIQTSQNSDPHIWAWFFLGSLVAVLIFLLWNLIINMKGGQ